MNDDVLCNFAWNRDRMDKRPDLPDWSLLRAFVAVAEAGSLSAAARRLGMSQPTVGRQIHALEAQMEMELFHRRPRGLVLTGAGTRLLPHARAMAQEARRIALIAAGEEARIDGTVRITASVFVAHHILPPILAELRRTEPGIAVEVVATDSSANLLFREADIALRMYRPTQLDIVTRHLGDVAMGAFAAPSYLDRRGRPRAPADLLDHDLIGMDRSDLILRGMRRAGLMVGRESFMFRTDHPTVYWELVRAGCGVGFGQTGVARITGGVEAVMPDLALPSLPLWLAAPERTRHTPRMSRVWDHLEDGLGRYFRTIEAGEGAGPP